MRVLRAEEIQSLSQRGMIIRDQFRPSNCEGITYSLTLGSRVQSISNTEQGYRKIEGTLVLGPREAVNVEINEKFNFMDEEGRPRYFGMIVAGARLLAGGISHPATVIDPGFRHTTTLTLINLRNFPSRAFRPGSDYIAKLIVFEFALREIPQTWKETAPYLQAGAEEPPVLWADFHMMPTWSPTRRASLADLETVNESFGPPYDLITAHLLEQRKLLYDHNGAPRVTLESLEALREEDRRIERSVQLLSRGLELVEKSHQELSDKVADGLTGLAEILRSGRAETDRVRREGIERRRYWLNIAIALISAVLGAAASVWLTLLVVR